MSEEDTCDKELLELAAKEITISEEDLIRINEKIEKLELRIPEEDLKKYFYECLGVKP